MNSRASRGVLLLVVGLLLLWCGLTGYGQEVQTPSVTAAVEEVELTPLERALALIPQDDVMIELSDQGREELEAAIAVFREALGVTEELNEESEDAVGDFSVDLEQKDLVNKLSQSYYTLADAFLEKDPDEETTYLRGKSWALKSLRMNPEFFETENEEGFFEAVKVEADLKALYWSFSNWARAAEFDKMKAIFAGAPAKLEALLLRCLELDDQYIVGGPYRALGAFWGGMPRLPFGTYRKNLNEALSYFCKVVDEPEFCSQLKIAQHPGPFDPVFNEYFENRLLFVEFYLMEEELWEDVVRVLESVLSEPIGDKFPLYNAILHEKAEKFLVKAKEHLE